MEKISFSSNFAVENKKLLLAMLTKSKLSKPWMFFYFSAQGQGDNNRELYTSWHWFYIKRQFSSIQTSIILISPYGSNDLLIRFTHSAVRQFKEDFVFALMKCSYAAFGEQNKRIIISITSVNIYLVSKIRGGCVKTDTPSFSYAKFPSENAPSSQIRIIFCCYSE